MKRLLWLLFAALGTVLLPVAPAMGAMTPPAKMDSMSCCGPDSACHHDDSSAPCADSARDCPACLPCAAAGCVAILSTADLPALSLSPVARVHSFEEKGSARNDPPPLPPPRVAA